MRRNFFIFFLFLIAFSSITLFVFYSTHIVHLNKNGRFYSQLNAIQCNPINDFYKQYTIQIDGHTYPKHLNLHTNKSINFKCLNQNKKLKLILLWNKFWDITDYRYGLGAVKPFRKNNCPVTQCELSVDKSRLSESDFVVVHMIDKPGHLPIQRTRPAKQRWIFFLYESPYISNKNYSIYNGFFNLNLK